MQPATLPKTSTELPPVLRSAGNSSVSPSPEPSAREEQRRANWKRWLWGGLAVLVILGAAGFYLLYGQGMMGPKPARPDLILHKARYEPLNLTVVERGALESADNREVVCRVKAGTKASDLRIRWVIEDGAQVKQGDRLVEIEDSALQDQLKIQKITLDLARSNMIAAEENYRIVMSQNESLIANAEIAVQLAELDLKKYQEGEYIQMLRDIEGRRKVAEADLRIQSDRTSWSERMFTRNYLSESQLKSEQSRLQSLQVNLDKVNEEKRVLNEYTKVRQMTDLTSKLNEAKRALERAKDQAHAKEIQSEIDRETRKSVYDQELDKYQDIEDQIRKCVIHSPQDGMVVYFVSDQSRFGSGSAQSIIAQGEPVREGQKLMRIPDLRRMLVNTRVHEAMVSRIKGEVWRQTGFLDGLRTALVLNPDPLSRLMTQMAMPEIRDRLRDHELEKIAEGMKASVRIDAFPDRVLRAHVKSVATVASQQDWMSADVKVYTTMVAIDESLEGLKPGMSAEVTIHVESTGENVLTVPLQAVVGGAELGGKRKIYVQTPEGPKEREILVGLANEKVVEIKSGLEEGEEVILNPKILLGDKVKTRQTPDERGTNSGKGGESGKSRGKGKGGANGAPLKGGEVEGGFPRGGPGAGPGFGGSNPPQTRPAR